MSDSAQTPDVFIYWRQRASADPRDRTLLVETAARFAKCDPRDILVSSFCPRCAGNDHGIPSVSFVTEPQSSERAGRPPLPRVSNSRCGDVNAVALTASGFVGVDVESVSRIAAADIDAVAFHPEERRALERLNPKEVALHRTILWAAKEAILKGVGTGLMTSPEGLHIDMTTSGLKLISWPIDLKFLVAPEITVKHIAKDHVVVVAHDKGSLTAFSSWKICPVVPS